MKELLKTPVFTFVASYLAFGLLGLLEGINEKAIYWVYPLKTVLVGALILFVWKRLELAKPRHLLLSVGVGIFVLLIWILPYDLIVKESARQGGYNPFAQFAGHTAWVLIAFRILGASLIVPVMEEAFIRGFLQRFLVANEFEKVPQGTYTHLSFWVTTAFFSIAHWGEWMVAIPTGVIFGAWYCYTRSLSSVMVAHGVTNFLLGVYVVATQKWYFW
ncbi:MAG: CAAX prenyl protease-related protein [Verrucomicrobiota bacterium]|nr:CAAX prenyl protease-related protein [Verrucomicrobiota bacterium]